MLLQHYNSDNLMAPTYNPNGKLYEWHGNYRLKEYFDDKLSQPFTNELHFERDCFLSILQDTTQKHVKLLDIGAGWGEWCLALDGVIKNKLINTTVETYECLAIDGDKTHSEWAEHLFKVQNIKGRVNNVIISDRIGSCLFEKGSDPARYYGQSILDDNSLRRSIRKFCRTLTNGVVRRVTVTLDLMLGIWDNYTDIMTMDVQGAEYKILKASKHKDKIGYMLIGVHSKELGKQLKELLANQFELVAEAKTHTKGFQDGVQLYKNRSKTWNKS